MRRSGRLGRRIFAGSIGTCSALRTVFGAVSGIHLEIEMKSFDFVQESNRIEGIVRDQTAAEVAEMKPQIVCAANRHIKTGLVVCGVRHFDEVMRQVMRALRLEPKNADWEQGFIDSWGQFCTREQAMDHVVNSGQKIKLPIYQPDQLFSENLY